MNFLFNTTDQLVTIGPDFPECSPAVMLERFKQLTPDKAPLRLDSITHCKLERLCVQSLRSSVMLGALRWHLLVRGDDQLGPRYSPSLACYWRSLVVGVVTPGSIGADAYRVLALGVQTQRYLRAVLLILVEKLAAAVACILIVALLLPLIQPIAHVPPWVGAVVLALVIGVIVILASALRRPQGWLQKVARVIYQRLSAPIQTWQLASVAERPSSLDFVVAPKLLAGVLAVSVAVFLVSALQAQLFFCAIGHDIAYRVNLFAAPLFFLVFTLPISF